MIFIDLSAFTPSDDWLYRAWFLNAELRSLKTIAEKLQFIDENRTFWGELKNRLPHSDKCWYSESKESVSVYEIEHFRPTKGTIRCRSVLRKMKTFTEEMRVDWTKATRFKGVGYWWLAFNYKNYRNSGKRINGIKSIRFPLRSNSFVAYKEEDDYEREEVALLDPTRPNDPTLLTFDPDGKAQPNVVDTSSFDYLRAFVSIEVYGLNAIETLVRHRAAKWRECYKAIRRATDKYSELEEAVNQGNRIIYDRYFDEFMDYIERDIKPAIDPSSEFSAVAKACVLSYSNHDWVKEYVLK